LPSSAKRFPPSYISACFGFKFALALRTSSLFLIFLKLRWSPFSSKLIPPPLVLGALQFREESKPATIQYSKEEIDGECSICGEEAERWVYFAKNY
jgi:hypothetical protein